jgi:hypothetical protein
MLSILLIVMITPQAFPLGHATGGAVRYSSNTALSSDVTCSDLVIDPGITLTTNGHSMICSGFFNNQGTIATGSTPLQNFPSSYAGSGGGAQSMLCNAAAGSGFSTLSLGGQGNSVDHVPTQGGTTPSPPALSNSLILSWYQTGVSSFLAGAGGQTVCGSILGGAGSNGVYIQANRIIAGIIDANGHMGSGTCSGQGLSGSGGGGVILFAYGRGGYVAGTYNLNGGTGAPSCDGLSISGVGGNGQVLSFAYGSFPPISRQQLSNAQERFCNSSDHEEVQDRPLGMDSSAECR